jgi:hypothetical protein
VEGIMIAHQGLPFTALIRELSDVHGTMIGLDRDFSPAVRRGCRWGREDPSSSAGRPPRRCLRSHLYVVRTLIPAAAAASAGGQCC